MDMLSRSWRVSNRRFKEVADWTPMVPDAHAGWVRIADAARVGADRPSPELARRP